VPRRSERKPSNGQQRKGLEHVEHCPFIQWQSGYTDRGCQRSENRQAAGCRERSEQRARRANAIKRF
jgi:hypothetical protein